MAPLLVSVLLLLAPAQRRAAKKSAPAAGSDRWPIAALQVAGHKILPADAILRASGLSVGQAVNRSDLELAAQRLTETGAFESLSFRYDPAGEKIVVTFQVQEVSDFYPVAFDRLEAPDAELVRYLREQVPLFGPQIPATGAMVQRVSAALEARLNTKITGRLQPGPDGALRMTFRPSAPPPNVTFVRFEGSRVFRAVDLQAAFYQTAVGVPYTERRLYELLDHNLRPLFEEKGRLRVKFGPLRAEESKAPEGVEVTVPVEDGDEFHFGAVRFEGSTQFTPKDLQRLAPLEAGGLANFALVNQGAASIERAYRRNGFLRAKVTVDRSVDDAGKSVDLVFRIAEGDQYRFRNLRIAGLDINAEAAVRRRWALRRDQPFDDSYADVFIQRVQEDAMFDRLAKIAQRVSIDEAAKAVDVELDFIAAPAARRPRAP